MDFKIYTSCRNMAYMGQLSFASYGCIYLDKIHLDPIHYGFIFEVESVVKEESSDTSNCILSYNELSD